MTLALHQPVLVEEVLQGLGLKPGGIYVDATVGAGGHAEAILESLKGEGTLIGIDQDEEILECAKERLRRYEKQIHWVRDHFDRLSEILKGLGLRAVDGILVDLGVSSLQLDRAERGFSFNQSGPLDMRMDQTERTTARDLVNRLSQDRLERIFRTWGEERFSKRIATSIVRARQRRPFNTTAELAQLITESVPRFTRIHPATRVFQALRIEVNHEMERLDRFLQIAPSSLQRGGRLAVISYHSLEDRRVKQAFRKGQQQGELSLITRKPIRPAEREKALNPRSRSARLRVAEKLQEGGTL